MTSDAYLGATILQLTPAEGWWAIYTNDHDTYIAERVACFALIKMGAGADALDFEVVPMSGHDYIEFCPTCNNFLGLHYHDGDRHSAREDYVQWLKGGDPT